jgi:hypothetical protein
MVAPFQILVAVGVLQGILNVLGEVFAGAGGASLRRRARIDVVWAIGTLAAIAVGVQLAGIRGAAGAHVVTAFCLAAAYLLWGVRSLGLPPRAVIGALQGVGACVLVQTIVTAAVALGIQTAGGASLAAGLVGAGAGALALAWMLRIRERDLLDECRAVVSAALRRQRQPA